MDHEEVPRLACRAGPTLRRESWRVRYVPPLSWWSSEPSEDLTRETDGGLLVEAVPGHQSSGPLSSFCKQAGDSRGVEGEQLDSLRFFDTGGDST